MTDQTTGNTVLDLQQSVFQETQLFCDCTNLLLGVVWYLNENREDLQN